LEINRNEKQTINTTAVVVSVERNNNNGTRSSIILINSSTGGQIITIAIEGEAKVNEGIVLHAGGVWQDSRDGGYFPTQKQITAISSGAGGQLSIQERVIKRDL